VASKRQKILICIDGGSRGNPGPAACAAVLKTADDGQTVLEEGKFLGRATNNVAEYEGLLLGLRLAATLKAEEIEIRSDSELLVRQLTGQYRVKNPALQELFAEAKEAMAPFEGVEVRHVRRELNTEADALLNTVLDEAQKKGASGGAKGETSGRDGSFRLK
jgi:ribonuclease HI